VDRLGFPDQLDLKKETEDVAKSKGAEADVQQKKVVSGKEVEETNGSERRRKSPNTFPCRKPERGQILGRKARKSQRIYLVCSRTHHRHHPKS
jgi:hypothetical protein